MTLDPDALSLSLGATDGPRSAVMQQCVRAAGLLFTSGHTSLTFGRVGDGLTTDEGRDAAREATLRLLHSVREAHGTLRGLHPVQLNVYIHSVPDFTEHGAIADVASALLRELFGEEQPPTRKALGVASLPRGTAVEIDAVFEVLAKA